MGGDFFQRGGGGRGELALILSLCEGGLKLIFANERGGHDLAFGVYFIHFPTPPPGNYCTVPKPLKSLIPFNLHLHCFQGQRHCYLTIPIVFPANQRQSFR